MTSFTVKVELSVVLAVEIDAPLNEFAYLGRCVLYYLLYRFGIRDVVACNHGVFDVFVEIVYFKIGHRCHTALCERCVSLIKGSLANDTDSSLMRPCNFQGVTHPSDTSADDEKVVLVYHFGFT